MCILITIFTGHYPMPTGMFFADFFYLRMFTFTACAEWAVGSCGQGVNDFEYYIISYDKHILKKIKNKYQGDIFSFESTSLSNYY